MYHQIHAGTYSFAVIPELGVGYLRPWPIAQQPPHSSQSSGCS